ncbi:MAG TPA: hypothetical protein VMD08_16310 [Candidatus Baltobacteraceae bacterium]|nr:hypothetical protein [Candidatus Baltobacteraceae bacterium]
MQLKLFRHPASRLSVLESEVNQWLAANPKWIPIQRETSVFHDRQADDQQILVAVWYEAKGNL